MKSKNYLLLIMLMMNAPLCGMYRPRSIEEIHREQTEEIQAQRFARAERCMSIVEAYCLMKFKEAQKQKESMDTQSSSKIIYKHQDQQAKL